MVEKALAVCGLQLIPFHSSYPIAVVARQNTCNEQAYICHRNNHWFAYRKIGDIWYDLNSLLSYPQQIKVEGTQLIPFAKPKLLNVVLVFSLLMVTFHKEPTREIKTLDQPTKKKKFKICT